MSISRLHLIFQNELNLFYDFEENASFEEELSNNEISMRNEEINPNLNNTETYFFEVNNEKAKLGFVEFPSQFSMKYEKKFDFGSIFPKLLLYFMCYGILELIYISNLFWLPMYLKIILGSNIFFIILILTLFEVGQIMGTICLPLLYEMGGKHPLIPIFFSSLMIVLCMFIHFFNDVPPSIYFIYFLLTGIILGGFRHIICYIISMDYKENRVYDFNSYGIGVVAVIVHGFGLLFSAIFQPLIPIFINSLFLFFGILMIFHSFLMVMYAYSTIKRKRSENLLSYDDSEEYY